MRQYFGAVFGNRETCFSLGKSIENDSLYHALLIEGDAGSGKRTLAKEIAKATLCECKNDSSKPLPCGACRACQLAERGLVPDIHYFSRGERATLGVEAVREMIADTVMASTEFDNKIYIFEDAHTMTAQAQNALLKVLEEPPVGVKIILLCESADAMLTTIRSRARLLRMQRFTADEIRRFLAQKENGVPCEEELAAVLPRAEGSIGRALTLLSPQSMGAIKKENDAIFALLSALTDKSYAPLYTALSALPQKREELCRLLRLFHTALRDLILLNRQEDPPMIFFSSPDAIPDPFKGFRIGTLLGFADATENTIEALLRNANTTTAATAFACSLRSAQKER